MGSNYLHLGPNHSYECSTLTLLDTFSVDNTAHTFCITSATAVVYGAAADDDDDVLPC